MNFSCKSKILMCERLEIVRIVIVFLEDKIDSF